MPAVYDPEQLDQKERTSGSSPPSNDSLRRTSGINPDEEKAIDERTKDPKELKNAEKPTQPHEDIVGSGYTGQGAHRPSRFRGLLRTRRRKVLFGGGLLAVLVTAAIALFISLIPLKILHIVNNLQDRFYATAENSMEKEVDRLYSNYLKKKIRLGTCKKQIDSSCNPFTAGDSLVTRLYRGWSNGRLEDKLWEKYGIRVKVNRAGGVNSYELQFKKQSVGVALRNNFINGSATIDEILINEGVMTSATRNEVRQAFRLALADESLYKKAMYRIKVGRLLENKYGIKRCIIGCKLRDNFADWKDDKKRAYKMYLSDRVLKPRAQIFGLMVDCILTPGLCNDILDTKPGPYQATVSGCTGGCTDGGEPLSDTERNKIRAELLRVLASQFDSDPVKLRQVYDDIYKNGFSRYLAGSIIERITGTKSKDAGNGRLRVAASFVAEKSSNAIPVIGQMILAAQIVDIVNKLPELIPKLVYISNSTSMVQLYTMYRIDADELKEGNVDAEILGTFVDSLGPGDHTIPGEGENQIGGNAGAEQTPLYGALLSSTGEKTKFYSPIADVFSPHVSAQQATPTTTTYLCKNNDGVEYPVKAGQLTCDEFDLRSRTRLASLKSITDALGPIWVALVKAADLINGAVGTAIDVLIGAVERFLGCKPIITLFGKEIKNPLCDALKALIGPFVSALLDLINPLVSTLAGALGGFFADILEINANLISGDMSGGRTFDLMAGGADISGNEFANHGLGGVALTEQQLAENLYYHEQNKLAEYKNQSIFARMLDTESKYSPVSKLALALPSNSQDATFRIRSFFATNPINKIFGVFSNLLSFGGQAGAATTQVFKDPFGVLQYGYPLDDPAFSEFNGDPETYWNTNCTTEPGSPNLTLAWNEYAGSEESRDPITFMPTNRKPPPGSKLAQISPYGTNRCLLIQAAVGSAGAVFTDDVLTPEEQADANSTSGSTGGISVGTGSCNSTVDQSPGDVSNPNVARYLDLIRNSAQGLSRPDCVSQFTQFCSVGVPNDCVHQYFAACSDNCVPFNGEIRVKYRDPPNAGNTISIKVQ
ncbi:MAG TPA: hypothetical protein VIK37_03170 [Candidatus Saccharimonadales bacterium]